MLISSIFRSISLSRLLSILQNILLMDDFQCFSSGIVEMRNIIGVINHHATHEDEALAVMVQRHPTLSAILSNGMTSPNNNRAVRLPRNIPLRKVSS